MMNQNYNRAVSCSGGGIEDASPIHAVKASQTSEMFHRCNKEQAQTHDLLEALESKLSMVLAPPSPEKDNGGATGGYSVELHGRIQSCIDGATSINARVAALMERVSI